MICQYVSEFMINILEQADYLPKQNECNTTKSNITTLPKLQFIFLKNEQSIKLQNIKNHVFIVSIINGLVSCF